VRPNGPKEGGGIPDRRDRTAHELGRARNVGTGKRKLEKDTEGRAEGERKGFMAVQKVAATKPGSVKQHHDRNYS
jgi:hypothetical protein